MAQNVDLAPTFLNLARVAPLAHADGHSLAPLLAGQNPPDCRGAALVEHHGRGGVAGDPDLPWPPGAMIPPSYGAIITDAETYIEYTTGEREYYDNRADLCQRINTIASVPPVRLDALHAILAQLADCHGTSACWQSSPPL